MQHTSARGYAAGGTVTVDNTITYAGSPVGLTWQVLPPDGWTFASSSGGDGDVKPTANAGSLLEWTWAITPPSPSHFSYVLNVPSSTTGSASLSALATFQAFLEQVQTVVPPDPLVLAPVLPYHSADTDRNLRISLFELTRMIELYNTRNGTSRTGAYKVQDATEDGFAAEPTRPTNTSATLTKYHSADSNRDGRFTLLELTRVIELYNFRSGTTRTGQYHVQSGTEDGFASGP